jgi:hypothetical protein
MFTSSSFYAMQILKAPKDIQVIAVVLRFWDLRA